MEARLYELIRAYQRDRASVVGASVAAFRMRPLVRFAAAHPSAFPEYVAEPGRIARAIGEARATGEVVPPRDGGRDDELMLRADRDRAI